MNENYENMVKLIENLGMSNKFDFRLFGMPVFINPNTVIQDLPIYIRSTSLPSTLSEITKARYGNIEHIYVSDVQVDNVICTFFDTREQKILDFFKKWQYATVYTDEFGSRKYYPDDYQSTINININDEATWEMTQCFPLSVGDFRLSYDNEDSFGTFDVTFNVHRLYLK